MNNWTPEAVQAEMDYRLERAQAAAIAKQVRKDRPSWLRRLRIRSATPRQPLRATTVPPWTSVNSTR